MSNIVEFFKFSKQQPKQRYESLLRPHISLLFSKACLWTQSKEDAEDLLQEVLVKLIGQVDKMAEVKNLAPWLVKVLYRHFVDNYRKKLRNPVRSESEFQFSDRNETGAFSIENTIAEIDDYAQLDTRKELVYALGSLSKEQKITFLLLEVKGYSIEETAKLLNESIGTIKSRNHRAKKKLKKHLQMGTFYSSGSC